jgi:hypothetical protein
MASPLEWLADYASDHKLCTGCVFSLFYYKKHYFPKNVDKKGLF